MIKDKIINIDNHNSFVNFLNEIKNSELDNNEFIASIVGDIILQYCLKHSLNEDYFDSNFTNNKHECSLVIVGKDTSPEELYKFMQSVWKMPTEDVEIYETFDPIYYEDELIAYRLVYVYCDDGSGSILYVEYGNEMFTEMYNHRSN